MSEKHTGSPILQPGRNCWRVEHAERIAFLVDGAAYFKTLRAAAARARHSLFILGWDIDSRLRLVPEGAGDGLPEPLGDFLNALAKRARDLHIYVLNWDFAMLYALDREFLPGYKLGWRTHRRVKFELDGAHPVGASQHQKIVVIDDRIAFVGGFDLTGARWDTPEHRPGDPRRQNHDGDAYGPFHDLQVAVDGEAAAALGELARERWWRATGRRIEGPHRGNDDPWPETLRPDLTDAPVGIARTEPKYEANGEVQEIKQLYLDSIAHARHHLYFENQFFTATSVAEALAERLNAPGGPEAVLVSRKDEEGWLEEATMGVLRARVHRRLCDTASADRYGSFYPHMPELGDTFINIHSKLMSMDDELLTIGSANLSNRSMGFDTECNLVIEAQGDERIREAIRGLRHRLLAEHLDTSASEIATQEKASGSMLDTIRALCGEGRSLRALEPEVSEELDASVPPSELIDPERPIDPERLATRLIPMELHASITGRVVILAGLLAFFLALAAAWRWTDLGDWLSPQRLSGFAESIQQMPAAPLVVLAAYVVGSLIVIPLTVMIAATVLVFGPWLGPVYAMTGSVLAAAVTYGLGRMVGRETVRRVTGSRLDRLSRALGRRGILAVATVRILPVAPFTIVNLAAGTTHIGLRDFILGTVIGLAPGIIVAALFIDRILAAIRDPGPGSWAVLAGVLVLVVAGLAFLRRSLRRRHAESG